MDGYITALSDDIKSFSIHPAIYRLRQYLDIFKTGEISYDLCLEMFRQQINIIESYNSNIGSLNLKSFDISSKFSEPIFNNINLNQKFSNGNNILDYAISHPRILLLLTRKGISSRNAIINCIKYNYDLSLYILLKNLGEFNINNRLSGYTRLLTFLEKILDISAKEGSETSLLYISRIFGDHIKDLGNIPLVTTIIYGYWSKFELLIQSGMNIQRSENESGLFDHLSPIEAACIFKRYFFVKKLIELGVDLNNHDTPSLLTLMCSPPSLRQTNFNLEQEDLYNTIFILLKSGLNLNAMQTPVLSAYKETMDLITEAQKTIKSQDIKSIIPQILTDCVLITESLRISKLPIEKQKIIKAIFFDLYFKEKQCMHITSHKKTHKLEKLSLNNLQDISKHIIKHNNCHIFDHVCNFLDGPAINTLSSIKYKI